MRTLLRFGTSIACLASPSGTSGARLASGVDLLELEADGVESVRRVVVTR